MPETIDARTLALRLIRLPEAHLATCDGDQPRVRPLSVAFVQGATLYFASFAHWGKVAELAANPKAELSFMDPQGRHLRLTGRVTRRNEPELRRRIYESFPMMKGYFPGPDDPRYVLYEFRSERVRVKDAWELEYREMSPEELEGGSEA